MWKLDSNVRVTVRDLDGNITSVKEMKNLITTVGLNMIRDGLYGPGGAQDLEVKVMAVGTDNTAPALTDTTLGNEVFRKARTSQSKPADAQMIYTQYLLPSEAVGVIEELGWFAGALVNPASPGGVDTGILTSRVLYSYVKTNIESITVERTDTFQEG